MTKGIFSPNNTMTVRSSLIAMGIHGQTSGPQSKNLGFLYFRGFPLILGAF